MNASRLDRARDRVVDAVERIAADRDLDVTRASNRAYDTALQDDELRALCDAHEAISTAESRVRHERDLTDQVYENTLASGRSLDDAIQARAEELVEEIIEETRRVEIEEGMTA